MTADAQYLLLWKGRQFGPLGMEQIRERLIAGDINRMHQINVDGRWQLLDEYLEKLRETDKEAGRAREQQNREAEMKRQFDAQLNTKRSMRQEEHNSLSHLIPKPPEPPPAFQPASSAPLGSPFDNYALDPSGAMPPPFPSAHARTSGFAITALVMGICNFIPFVNFVSWILALVFGHIALSQMKSDESLKGRGLAIAGLVITYFLLLMGTTVIALCLLNNKPLPFHF